MVDDTVAPVGTGTVAGEGYTWENYEEEVQTGAWENTCC